jgi:hypothetical protein
MSGKINLTPLFVTPLFGSLTLESIAFAVELAALYRTTRLNDAA